MKRSERAVAPSQDVRVRTVGDVALEGILAIPPQAQGVVAFAHGSGSSRFSRRNQAVARHLQEGGLATLLLDLLTAREGALDERTGHLRFDIPLLGERMTGVVDWLQREPRTRALPIGLFGASTGAAAALLAAADRPHEVQAVVSRGGRPDLAGTSLGRVRCPTLLIVGGHDPQVLDLNQAAAQAMATAPHTLQVVPGATHLFEEPGTLEQVADLALEWFARHLPEER